MSQAQAQDQLLQRPPPADVEAERAVLGAALLEPRVLDELELTPEDFYRASHARIYAVCLELRSRGALDVLLLNTYLATTGELEAIGGTAYLAELTEAVPTAANASYYAAQVRGLAWMRRLITSAARAQQRAYEHGQRWEETAAEVAALIDGATQERTEEDWVSAEQLAREAMAAYDDRRSGRNTAIPTGYRALDAYIDGWEPGQLALLAARPSMGKSTMLWNFALRLLQRRVGVAIFSVEMSRRQVMRKLAVARAGIDDARARRGELARAEEEQLGEALDWLAVSPLQIGDWTALSAAQLRTRARRAARRGARVVMLDYIQLVGGSEKHERDDLRLTEVARTAKALARELDVAMICAAQINRGNVQRADKRPQLTDLRGSDGLAFEADLVLFVHRPGYYNPDADPNEAELIVAKQRDGDLGRVELRFVRTQARFEEVG